MSTQMYCGLLDDFAVTHKIGRPIEKLPALNQELLSSVLFGDPVIVNDGHLLLNKSVQNAILESKDSLFRYLVKSGYVTILTRNEGKFGDLADFMAKQKIMSAMNLQEDPHFLKVVQPELDSWSKSLAQNRSIKSFKSWPNIQTKFVYKKLATQALDALEETEPQLLKEFEGFRGELGNLIDSRTGWEETAKTLRANGTLTANTERLLMGAAYDAYNYMWGCLLTTDDSSTRIQTAPSRLLESLDKTVGEVAVRHRSPIELFVPDLAFAGHAIDERWVLLDAFNESGPVRYAKENFKSTLTNYYSDSGTTLKQMRAASKEYGSALSKHFANTKKVEKRTTYVFAVLPLVAIPFVGVPAVAISVGTMALGLAGGSELVQRKFLSHLASPKRRGWIHETKDSVAASWFELSPKKARSFVEGAPLFLPPAVH